MVFVCFTFSVYEIWFLAILQFGPDIGINTFICYLQIGGLLSKLTVELFSTWIKRAHFHSFRLRIRLNRHNANVQKRSCELKCECVFALNERWVKSKWDIIHNWSGWMREHFRACSFFVWMHKRTHIKNNTHSHCSAVTAHNIYLKMVWWN